MSFLGYPRETAPFLSELSTRSAVFENAFSASTWTAPATASLVTGRYPTDHGIVEGFMAHQARTREVDRLGASTLALDRFPERIPTLAELLRSAGYATYGLASNINIGERGRSAPPVFAHRQERDRHLWAVLDGRWKLIHDGRSPALFDLRNDRAEQRNLAAGEPEITARLSEEIDRFKAGAFQERGARIDVPLDRRTLETLRTLGYVD